MHWSDDWIGIPYRELGRGPDGYDCLGLFATLQRERHGREIFDPLCTMAEAIRDEIARREKLRWRPVSEADEGCAVLFNVRGFALHVGYALDDRMMLHTSQETGESLIECFRSAHWGDRLEGIYAYAG